MTETAGERTRARILHEALPLFAEHGFAGTSVRRVAGAADVNVATLAYHFTDKDGLYAACVEQMYDDLAGMQVPLAAASGSLEDLIRAAWDFATAHRVHVRLLHRHFLDSGEHHAILDTWLGPILERARPILELLQPGRTDTEHRLFVYSFAHLVVRFVLDDPAYLRVTLAIGPDDDVDDVLVAWIARMMRAQLDADRVTT